MNGPKATVVAIVAILVGLLIGWLYWGTGSRTLQDELARVRTQAEQAARQEQAAGAKLAQIETQLRELQAELAREKAAREALEGRVSRGRK
jgi:F0F1-type ATP synthase membrane subunit b/b'